MMATLIRVKRRIDEEPADALIVQCKRMRPLEDEAAVPIIEQIQNCFDFAGTVAHKDAPVSQFLATTPENHGINARRRNPKSRTVDVSGKLRRDTQSSTGNGRFKLVNMHRGLDPTTLDADAKAGELPSDDKATDAEAQRLFSLIDVVEEVNDVAKQTPKVSEESPITCNGVPMLRSKRPTEEATLPKDYVYDVYFKNAFSWDDHILNNSVMIEKFMDPELLIDRESDEEEYVADDDEDSNDENYYKNDYPEEDPRFENDTDYWENNEEEVLKELTEFCLESDDDGDDGVKLAFSKPCDEDVEMYGSPWARYRANLLKDLGE